MSNIIKAVIPKMNEHEIVKTAADILTQSESVFTKEQLRIHSSHLNHVQQNPVSIQKIETAINRLIKNKQLLINLTEEGIKGRVQYMTTKGIKTLEANIVSLIEKGF